MLLLIKTMPIKSYLVHPHEGKYDDLLTELSSLSFCEVIQSENKEIAVLITDTNSDQEDKNIQIQINSIKSLKMLSLVSGFETHQ